MEKHGKRKRKKLNGMIEEEKEREGDDSMKMRKGKGMKRRGDGGG